MALNRTPLLCTDINPYINSTGVSGDSNEVKAGVTSWMRAEGYPSAPGRCSGLAEVIESGSPQPTMPVRISGFTPLALTYDPAAGVGGPALIWGVSPDESGSPWNFEDIPDTLIPRRDGDGFIALCHYGNNGAAARQILGKYNTSYDLSTGWDEISKPIVALGAASAWDDDIVADANFVWLSDGTLIGFYRGGATWNTDAQIGRVSGSWSSGLVASFPTLTKDAGNPVIATGAGGAWSNSGIAPGGVIVDEDGTFHMWPGARVSSNGFGYASSTDQGVTWTVSAAAVITPSGTMTSAGDQVWPQDERTPLRPYGEDLVWIDFGADRTTSEGRNLAILPYEKALGDIDIPGKFYYPSGTAYSNITAGASGGGVQQYSAGCLAMRFRIARTIRTNFPTAFQQGDPDTDNHTYLRVGTTGLLTFFWSTTQTSSSGPPYDVTVTSSSAVDDALWHDAVVAWDTGVIRLWVKRNGAWALEDTDTSEADLGTFTSAVSIAVGNAHPTNPYGDFPFRGTIAKCVFVSGSLPSPTDLGASSAAFEGLLSDDQTIYSGGTLRWDQDDATDNGDVVDVEAAGSLDVSYVSTDGSTGTGDQTATNVHFIETRANRVAVLRVSWKNATTGPTTITLNGVDMTLAVSSGAGAHGSAIYYQKSPATGTATWVVTVDGASGEVNASFECLYDRAQAAPYDTASASGTSTSISATVGAIAGAVMVDAGHNAGGTDDATPHGTQTEQVDFATDTTNASRLFGSIRPAFVAGEFDMSWTGITNATQHYLVAASFAEWGTIPDDGAFQARGGGDHFRSRLR